MDNQFINENKPYLVKILYFSLLILIIVLGFIMWQGKYNRIFLLLATPFVLLIITNPRWAVYQFLFSVFIFLVVIEEIAVLLIDLSALIVILAALLDLLFSNSLPKNPPKIFVNLCLLLTAIVITGIFGFDPEASLKPLSRVALLTLTFLSLYRLIPKIKIENAILIFFWLTVAHSIINLIPFITTGGTIRSFGLSGLVFDEITMISLIVGVSYYLWCSSKYQILYGLASVIILGALIATQSRAPIMFAFIACLAGIFISYFKQKRLLQFYNLTNYKKQQQGFVESRIGFMSVTFIILFVMVIGLNPDLLAAVLERFGNLLTTNPSGTFYTRLELWTTAILSFLGNPLTGIGPGTFKMTGDIFPTLHLRYGNHLIQNLSAHNLFLHYLAETGLIGATALAMLIVNQYRKSYTVWKSETSIKAIPCKLSLLLISLTFLISTFIEGGWLWGQQGYIFVLFLAMIAWTAREK